jgi:DNA-directed RNA polymerase subunit RPC12/RpoP
MSSIKTTNRNATKAEPPPDSSEITGDYRCSHCGDTAEFIGFDDHGFPGDACECGQRICECQVTLRQPFRVLANGQIVYVAFTGGGWGAEIGSYDRIECGRCGRQIWPASEFRRRARMRSSQPQSGGKTS